MFCVVRAGVIYPTENPPEQVSKYEAYQGELNFDGIEFLVRLKNILRFERQNCISVSMRSDMEKWKKPGVYSIWVTQMESD